MPKKKKKVSIMKPLDSKKPTYARNHVIIIPPKTDHTAIKEKDIFEMKKKKK